MKSHALGFERLHLGARRFDCFRHALVAGLLLLQRGGRLTVAPQMTSSNGRIQQANSLAALAVALVGVLDIYSAMKAR